MNLSGALNGSNSMMVGLMRAMMGTGLCYMVAVMTRSMVGAVVATGTISQTKAGLHFLALTTSTPSLDKSEEMHFGLEGTV